MLEPADTNALSRLERKIAIESLVFLAEKRDSTIECIAVANSACRKKKLVVLLQLWKFHH